ncbi:MAG: glycerol-3-phosphate 1-O-acyltransferase PlsY [Candidatus Puniceispirillaceae bacterium]
MSGQILVWAIAGYLAGSVPFGLVSAYLAGLGDIRKIGSGNIGATNVLRSGNKLAAFSTLVGDAGKGAAIVFLCLSSQSAELAALVGFMAVIGHCYPIWLGFKGGKGVATALATLAVLSWPAGLAMAVTWLVMSLIFKISSLSALTGFLAAVIISIIYYDEWLYIVLIALLSFWRHRDNIKRLIAGEESRINFSSKK